MSSTDDISDTLDAWLEWITEGQLLVLCPFPEASLLGSYMMWFLGLGLVGALYVLIGLHFVTYINLIAPLLKKRFGTELGLLWLGVGLVLVYNIVYNHFLAMFLRPGNLKDLKMIEKMRESQKNRANRKSVAKYLDDENDCRFEGLSADVKKLLRYRQKTTT